MVKIIKLIKKGFNNLKDSIHRLVEKLPKNKHFWKNVVFLCAAVAIVVGTILLVWITTFNIPDFRSFEDRKIENSTKIYDRTGEIVLYDIHENVKRTYVTSDKISINVKNATIAIEDAEFYNHSGVRISSTIRAVLSNIFGIGIGGGGSTITQQLIKNTLLTPERTFTKKVIRKMKEWILAVKIEKTMTKDSILEFYLNEAPYGGTLYGIQEASKTYFSKDALNLSIAESAYLAAIPQSPSVLSPYGKNKERLETRKNLVLSRMLEEGFITQEEYDVARNELVAFTPQEAIGIKAAHFVFFVKDYLEEKYGAEMVQEGGLKVTTTLDYKLQEKGEQFVKEVALKNEKDWNGENGALVAIDPRSGQILTMVGSRDYFDKEVDGKFNVTTAVRQPGSSFKPFIYATAFNKGFTPSTVLFDVPTEFQSTCNAYGKALPGRSQADCYMPNNYDNLFRGPMTLKDALAQSINVIAVKLFYLSGLGDSLKTAEDMGISTLTDINRYGLTLVIGGGEVSLLDMTSAYGVFANDGVRNPYTGILKVEDSSGNVLEEFIPQPRQVLPKNSALIVSDILKDEAARVPTFGSHSALYIPGREVAVKTGPPNNNKDAWILGYTPSIVAGAWAGNNDNTPMKKGGAALAGPMWNKFMNEALKTLPDEQFEKPNLATDSSVKPALRGFWQGNETFLIDKISGKLATEFTPPELIEEKVVTNVHSILYWVDRNDILGPAPANPEDNSQFSNWETAIQNWWALNSYKYVTTKESDVPTTSDNIHTENSAPKVSITQPNSSTTYLKGQKIQLKLNSSGKFPLNKVDVFINDIFIESLESPFNFAFIPQDLENLESSNTIKVIAYDSTGNRTEATSKFKVAQ